MKKLVVIVALVLLAFGVGQAQAAVIIDFGDGGVAGGTIAKNGSLYVGSGILVPAMKLVGTPLNAGTYVTDAVLNFAYDGGQVNWVTVTGGFAPAGIAPGSVLLSGSFTSVNVIGFSGGISFQAAGPDRKNDLLLAFAGLPAGTPFELFGFSLATSTLTPDVYAAFSTDISNTVVPEPGSMLLLGTGLFGLAGVVRRRLKK
jgi:hypothetical protein